MAILALLSLLLGVAVLPAALYLGGLALLARVPRESPASHPPLRFIIVVPAHNEAASISATVESLYRLDYPPALFGVTVVADNCSDETADLARAQGAHVLVRSEAAKRGKGYALAFAFDHLLRETDADAFVVVDADSIPSPNLLRAFARLLAAGEQVIQAEYGVRNPVASWRTRLMTVTLAMFHRTRSLGRARLGLSAGLRGNGMCFSRRVLTEVPHRAAGLVEDVEYSLDLALWGHKVAYAASAWVRGEMVSKGGAAASQRRRWEAGRLALARTMVPKLLRAAIQRRSLVLAELALDLLVPPLSYVALALGLGLLAEGLLFWHTQSFSIAVYPLSVSLAALGLYGARGLQHCGLGFAGLLALGYAPVYVAWKLWVARPGRRDSEWIRTAREDEQGPLTERASDRAQ